MKLGNCNIEVLLSNSTTGCCGSAAQLTLYPRSQQPGEQLADQPIVINEQNARRAF
jgi:hypothetical protein